MPVDSTHLDYDANVFAWWRARDVFAGEDAIKAAGTRYLPRLDSQTEEEYRTYKLRASFYNATARTAEGLVGLVFHRTPSVKLPDDQVPGRAVGKSSSVGRALAEFAKDADMAGTRLTAYAKNIANEVVLVGRAGSLVDWGASRTGNSDSEGRA